MLSLKCIAWMYAASAFTALTTLLTLRDGICIGGLAATVASYLCFLQFGESYAQSKNKETKSTN